MTLLGLARDALCIAAAGVVAYEVSLFLTDAGKAFGAWLRRRRAERKSRS